MTPPVLEVVPVEVVCTVKAEGCNRASAKCQFSSGYDGFAVQNPKSSLADAFPPVAYESGPFVTSLSINCMPCTVKLRMGPACMSNDSLASKPSGLISGSKVSELRCQGNAHLPPVSDSHLCATWL